MFEYIEFIICFGEGVTPALIKDKTHIGKIVYARQLIFYFSKMFKIGTLAEIGKPYDKDHATVLHSIKTINNYLDTDKVKKMQIEYYEALIRKVIELSPEINKIKVVIEPLNKQIAELEARCINLTLQVAFLKSETEKLAK